MVMIIKTLTFILCFCATEEKQNQCTIFGCLDTEELSASVFHCHEGEYFTFVVANWLAIIVNWTLEHGWMARLIESMSFCLLAQDTDHLWSQLDSYSNLASAETSSGLWRGDTPCFSRVVALPETG